MTLMYRERLVGILSKSKIKPTQKIFFKKYPFKVAIPNSQIYTYLSYARALQRIMVHIDTQGKPKTDLGRRNLQYYQREYRNLAAFFVDHEKRVKHLKKLDKTNSMEDISFYPHLNYRFGNISTDEKSSLIVYHLENCLKPFFNKHFNSDFTLKDNPDFLPIRASGHYSQLSFYFNDPELYISFLNSCPTHIVKAYQPASEEHLQDLFGNKDNYIDKMHRMRLFNDLYKYKIKINQYNGVRELYDQLTQIFSDRKHVMEIRLNQYSVTVLTNQIEDYGIIRLITNRNEKIQEAVLVKGR
jgi:hypothetical protein